MKRKEILSSSKSRNFKAKSLMGRETGSRVGLYDDHLRISFVGGILDTEVLRDLLASYTAVDNYGGVEKVVVEKEVKKDPVKKAPVKKAVTKKKPVVKKK